MGVPDLSSLPPWATDLLDRARIAHLGLLDEEGRPRVLPVTFAVADRRIWSAVDEKPKRAVGEELARVRFLRRDGRAALTVDRYSDDWEKLAWVQVLANVEIRPVEEEPEALAALLAKYATYRNSPPPGPLLGLAPERCLYWSAAGDR